jgi:hypothetical protein
MKTCTDFTKANSICISTIVIDSKSFEIAALLNKNKIGNIYLNIEYENNKPFFKLELLNVKPEARGLHIGSSLVNAAISNDLLSITIVDIQIEFAFVKSVHVFIVVYMCM